MDKSCVCDEVCSTCGKKLSASSPRYSSNDGSQCPECHEIVDLQYQRDAIWDSLLQTPWGSKEAKILEEKYVAVCRNIRRREQLVHNQDS